MRIGCDYVKLGPTLLYGMPGITQRLGWSRVESKSEGNCITMQSQNGDWMISHPQRFCPTQKAFKENNYTLDKYE